jgi:DNA-binding protein YbaB
MTNEYTALNDILGRYGRSSEAGASKKIAAAADGLSSRFTDMMAATAEGTDASGYVTAVVKLPGRVESVYISPQAIRNLPGRALDQACLEAITAARKAGAASFTEKLEDLTGQRLDLDQA